MLIYATIKIFCVHHSFSEISSEKHKHLDIPTGFPLGKVIYMLSGRLLPNEISSAITIKTKQRETERERNDKRATVSASM
jgi:hypothetical protein